MSTAGSAAPSRVTDGELAPATTPRWVVVSSLLLCLVGLAVSIYLTIEHFSQTPTYACPETGVINCAKVTSSSYATILGIPVAVLGLGFFVAMTALCLPPVWSATGRASQLLPRFRLGFAAAGVIFVCYLLWVELFQLNAVCLWCSVVHVTTVALFATLAFGLALSGGSDPAIR